jgi:biofilm PGA synthesis N-glycosyltransferase PgaC
MRTHGRELARWRHRHLWPVFVESVASLAWVSLFSLVIIATIVRIAVGDSSRVLPAFPAWGVAVGLITAIQFVVALSIELRYDRTAPLAMVAGPLYPAGYWLLNGVSAITSQLPAVIRGPRRERVHWDTHREPGKAAAGRASDPPSPERPRAGA